VGCHSAQDLGQPYLSEILFADWECSLYFRRLVVVSMVSELTMVINLVLPALEDFSWTCRLCSQFTFKAFNVGLVSFDSIFILTLSVDEVEFNMLL
jgi:hypothetical protein